MFNKKRCFTRRRDVVLLCFVVVLLVAVVVTFGICFYDSHLKYVWPFLCVSLCLSRLQHCGVLTHVDWTGLSVSKPAPYYLSLSVCYCPKPQLWNCRSHFLPTVQRLRLRLHHCLNSAPAPYADATVEQSATQKIFLSPPSTILAVCFFSLLWFGRGSMFVPQFVACCHSAGELLAVHTCNQIAAPPDLRLACGLGNFIVPRRTRRAKHKERRNSSMIREFYTWNTLGLPDAGALTSS